MSKKEIAADELEVAKIEEEVKTVVKEPSLEMSIQDLRKWCGLYRVPIANTMTKEEILSAIKNKQRDSSKDFAKIVDATDGAPAPGWSRIELHRDGNAGASNRPQYFGCNGYNVTIPRGVVVDVPTKVLGVIRDTTTTKKVENEEEPLSSPRRWVDVTTMAFPFNLIAQTPGPDPRPGFEKGKLATYGPRADFHEKFGYWPTKDTLREAQKNGFVITKPPVNLN